MTGDVREYIGARYVPVFADPVTWNRTSTYEALTMVTWEGATYTSRQPVPSGIDITNTDYWIVTGNYNAQVETYRQEVQRLAQDVAAFDGEVDAEALARQQADEQLATDIASEVQNRESADTQLAADIASEVQNRESADEQITDKLVSDERSAIFKSRALDGLTPIYRLERDDQKWKVSGCCYFEVGGVGYYAASKLDTSVTPNRCDEIEIINLNTGVKTPLYGDFVNCNQIVPDPYSNKLIASGIRRRNDSHCVAMIIDVSNPGTPFVESTVDLNGLTDPTSVEIVGVSRYDETHYFGFGRIYVNGVQDHTRIKGLLIDNNFSSATELFTVTVPVNVYRNTSSVQEFLWIPELERALLLITEGGVFFDSEGNLIDNFILRDMYSFVSTGEPEGCSYVNGCFYIGNTVGQEYTTGTGVVVLDAITPKVTTLFKYDPNNVENDVWMHRLANPINYSVTFNIAEKGYSTLFDGKNLNGNFIYPQDLANALRVFDGYNIEVNQLSDIDFPIFLTAPCSFSAGYHFNQGVIIYSGNCLLRQIMNSSHTKALMEEHLKLHDSYNRPCYIFISNATPIYMWEIAPVAADDYWLFYSAFSQIWVRNNLYTNTNFTDHISMRESNLYSADNSNYPIAAPTP